jgi:hypothetical protein
MPTYRRRITSHLVVAVFLSFAAGGAAAWGETVVEPPPVHLFFDAASSDPAEGRKALDQIGKSWKDGYASMLVELARFSPRAGLSGQRKRLTSFLEERTGQRFGEDIDRWYQWIWSQPYEPHPDYARFKGELYSAIDPQMRGFFHSQSTFRIRLDEIVWGGVAVNGIPPLRHPKTITAEEAPWLGADDVVFGITIAGETRAYPKRILAWHEMAIDRLGGVDLTVVYCTLCGSVIPYASRHGEDHHHLGTSGFLYRSNKLMFDEKTRSLWSTTYGKPVSGPLVDRGIRLETHPVVTTTWNEWKSQHPDTTVLSLDTGFQRDYGEGVAYREYFATDDLMFNVPRTDARLKNKAEVLILPYTVRAAEEGNGRPVAVSANLLREQRMLTLERAGKRLLVLTSKVGANRVYEIGDEDYNRRIDERRIEDASGRVWKVTEDALVPRNEDASPRRRIPAHRAFWFGWYAQHPDTELIRTLQDVDAKPI